MSVSFFFSVFLIDVALISLSLTTFDRNVVTVGVVFVVFKGVVGLLGGPDKKRNLSN